MVSRHHLSLPCPSTDLSTASAMLTAALSPAEGVSLAFLWREGALSYVVRVSHAACALQSLPKLIPASPCSGSMWQSPFQGSICTCPPHSLFSYHCCFCVSAELLIPHDRKALVGEIRPFLAPRLTLTAGDTG